MVQLFKGVFMKYNNSVSLEEELIQSIRGYSGYQKTESREKTDKRLREYLASEIKQIEKVFLKISKRVTKQGNLTIADSINRLINQLKNLIETLNNPTYNNSPFFNSTLVNSNILSQLYEYESLLTHHISILTDEVSELQKIDEISETNEFLNHLFDVVDNLNQIIMEREFLLARGSDNNI